LKLSFQNGLNTQRKWIRRKGTDFVLLIYLEVEESLKSRILEIEKNENKEPISGVD